jgi:CBS domain-containing protein
VNQSIKDVMTKDPASATKSTQLYDVANMMVQYDCGEIPIVDASQRTVVGVVTDRDIVCRVIAKKQNPLEASVEQAMSSPAVTIKEDASIDEAVRLMSDRQLRRLPVVDAQGKLIGIVAQADLAQHAGSEQAAEVVKDVSKPKTSHGEQNAPRIS